MKIDYQKLADEFKPDTIKILLIGEAPPPGEKKYFYKVPENYKPSGTIEKDTSLPATIFNHYFGRRPKDSQEYSEFLYALKKEGIFLIDIITRPIRIRGKSGQNIENLNILFSDDNLDHLEKRIRELSDDHTEIIFLLARNYAKPYMHKLKNRFVNAKFIRWIIFRMTSSTSRISRFEN